MLTICDVCSEEGEDFETCSECGAVYCPQHGNGELCDECADKAAHHA